MPPLGSNAAGRLANRVERVSPPESRIAVYRSRAVLRLVLMTTRIEPTCLRMQQGESNDRPWRCALHPDRAVEAAVLDRLEEVIFPDGFGLGQVGNGPRHLEDSIVGASTEMEIIHGMLQKAVTGY